MMHLRRLLLLFLFVSIIGCSKKSEKEPYITFRVLDFETQKPLPNMKYAIREYETNLFALASRHLMSEGYSDEKGLFSFRLKTPKYYDIEVFDCGQPMKIIGLDSKKVNHKDTMDIICKDTIFGPTGF